LKDYFAFFQLNSWKERLKRGGKSWIRRTKRPLFKRGRKEEQRCGKERNTRNRYLYLIFKRNLNREK
jgi:hypothetical protein